MKNLKNRLLFVFSLIMAFAFTLGVIGFNGVPAMAEDERVFTVEMLDGARLKTLDNSVYLVFEAKINNCDLVEGAEYGFEIIAKKDIGLEAIPEVIPATVVDVNTAKTICTIRGLYDVKGDYETSFYAKAYAVVDGEYIYAESNPYDNARSASYVAQMAINYDGYDEERIAELERIAGYMDSKDTIFSAVNGTNDFIVSGSSRVNGGEEFVLEASLGRFSWDEGYDRGIVTKTNYEAITEINFDVMIPAEANVSWWGAVILADKGLANGDAAYIGAGTMANLGHQIALRNTWYSVKYISTDGLSWDIYVGLVGETLEKKLTFEIAETEVSNYKTEDNKSYVAIIGEYGRDKTNYFVQIDNVKIVADYGEEYTDSFDGGESALFNFGKSQLGGTPARVVYGGNAGIEISDDIVEEVEGEGYAEINFTKFKSGFRSYTTKDAYSNITEMKVDIFIPSTNEINHWWGFAPVASNSGDAYMGSDAVAGSLNLNALLVQNYGWTNMWVTLTYKVEGTVWTLSIARTGIEESYEQKTFDFAGSNYSSNGASYIFICANPDQPQNWGILMDNFVIVAGGVTYTENFNKGKSDLFVENVECADYHFEEVGGEEEIEGEGHAIVSFSKFKEGHQSLTTKDAYSNITEMKVDVFIPSTNEVNHWWGFVPVAAITGDAYTGSEATAGAFNINKLLVQNYGWTNIWVTLTYKVEGTVWTLSIARTGIEESYEQITFDASDATYSSNGASYIFLGANPDQAKNWGILMDNFVIVADGKTYTEDFNKGSSDLFVENTECVEYYFEEVESDEEGVEGEGYLVADVKKFSEATLSFRSAKAYKNITSFSVDIYVPSANEDFAWHGFTPSATVSGDGYTNACTGGLNLNMSVCYYGWTNMWVTLTYTVDNGVWKLSMSRKGYEDNVTDSAWALDATSSAYTVNGESYIVFSACPGKTFAWEFWIDNVVIVADGKTYTDNFNTGKSNLFTFDSATTVVYTAPEGYEPPVEKTFEERLSDGTADDYLRSDKLSNLIYSEEAVNLSMVSGDCLAATVDLTYRLGDKSTFVIILSLDGEESADFLYVTEDSILLYANDQIVSEIAVNKQYSHDLRIAVLGNGTVIVSVDNSDFIALGVADVNFIAFAGVDTAQPIIFTEIAVTQYFEQVLID